MNEKSDGINQTKTPWITREETGNKQHAIERMVAIT